MNELFDRYIRIRVGDLDATGLHASFQVIKSLESEPNSAEFKIYNLKESNRKKLHETKDLPVEISVGYNGMGGAMANLKNGISPPDGESLMFKGDIKEVWSEKQGPDWITHLRTQDGINAFQRDRLLRSYKSGMPMATILMDLVRAYSVDSKNALAKIASLPDLNATTTLSNYIISGSVSTELAKILARFGLSYSIQDGELVILGELEGRNVLPIEVSSSSGLIGSPEPGKGKKNGFLRFTSLIQPQLAPGKLILLNSSRYKGVYKIHKVEYTGSAFDNNWYANIEAQAIS